MMLPRTRPLALLAPLLGVTIFVAAQSGLQTVRPSGLDVRIKPRTTADYGPWPVEHVQPIDPALSTVVARDENPTPIIVNTPNPNVPLASIKLPTTNPNEPPRVVATQTLVIAAPAQRATNTPTSLPTVTQRRSDTPVPTTRVLPSSTPTPQPTSITGTPTNSVRPANTRRPRVQPTKKPKNDPPGKGGGKK